jgi:Rrf2 family protein
MKLPRSEDTAILLCCVLANNTGKTPVSLSSIAACHGLSALFLKKLARLLKEKGYLKSKEGVGGGYLLAKPPSRISVWNVISAIHPEKQTDNPIQIHCPINKQCLPQNIRQTIDRALEKHLSQITIADLL